MYIRKSVETKNWEKVYTLLLNTYDALSSITIFPKCNYIFHIDTINVVSLMQHIQEKLQLKAGRLHNVTISGHKLKKIPVYECGGRCIRFFLKNIRIH